MILCHRLTHNPQLGTQRNVDAEGYQWINHSMFPRSAAEVECRDVIGGPDCKQPYSASLLNISAMSFGALSANAIEALNLGAMDGGFYHNTGEGGISKYHLSGGDLAWNVRLIPHSHLQCPGAWRKEGTGGWVGHALLIHSNPDRHRLLCCRQQWRSRWRSTFRPRSV